MRKLVRIITAAILSVAFIGTVASAQTPPPVSCDTITIINSGDDSQNTVECNTITNTIVDCVDNIIVANVNFQDAESGEGEVSGNNGTGSVNTGTAVNYNNTATTVGASCVAIASPSPSVSPSPSATPVTPGQGGAGAAVQPAALPNTAGASAEAVVVASLAAAAAVVVLSRFAVAAYRRFNTK